MTALLSIPALNAHPPIFSGTFFAHPPSVAARSMLPSAVLYLRVNIATSEVSQRWIFDKQLVADGQDFEICRTNEINLLPHVEYHVRLKTINQYTSLHKLPGIVPLSEHRSYHCPVILQLTKLALPYLQTPSVYSPAFMNQFQDLLFGQILHLNSAGLPEPVRGRGGLSSRQRRTVTEFLTTRGFRKVKMTSLAEACGLSSSHFARSFKISFGQSVHAWILDQRVQRAKRVMLETEESLIDVAFRVGFPDQTTFNRTFLRIEGLSPGRWKRIHKL